MSYPRLALALLVATAGCGLVNFDVEQPIAEQQIAGSPLGGVLPQLFPQAFPITINVKSETDARGTGPATNAQLKSLTLFITPKDAPKANFDFVNEIRVFVESPSDKTLAKKEIATATAVRKGTTVLEFTIAPEVNLLPYINAGADISTTASGTQPSSRVTFAGNVVIKISI